MDKMLRPQMSGQAASSARDPAPRPSSRGVRAHPLVACLAGGLQATYAARADDAMPDHFASLIERLERGGPEAR